MQISKSNLTVGSSSHCDVVVDHPTVHADHLRAWTEGGRVWIQDLDSGKGTRINGIPLPPLKAMLMRDIDVLKLGECESTITLEALVIRQPAVRAREAKAEAVVSDVEENGFTEGETAVERRREELEALSREMAEAKLQLQMAQLEQATADELSKQIQKMRNEIKVLNDQKGLWEKTQQHKYGEERFAELSQLVHMWVGQKVRPWERQIVGEGVITQWENDLNRIFRRVLLRDSSPVEAAAADLGVAPVKRESRRNRRNRIWSQQQIIAGCVIVVCALGSAWIFSRMNIRRVDKARVPASQQPPVPSARVAAPAPVKGYRGSYTDNILYTDKYLENERNLDFRKSWLRELGRAVTSEWKMDGGMVASALAKEAALIDDLERLKGNGPKAENIQLMRAREAAFQKDLAEVFRDRAAVDKFFKLKRSFYVRQGH